MGLQTGSTVPSWGGNHAGQPGKGYAKILQDAITGESPVINYWKPTLILSDNRIPARATDVTSYAFTLPSDRGSARVTATLIFRRAFQSIEQARGWSPSDIVMAQAVVTSSVGYPIYFPAIIK